MILDSQTRYLAVLGSPIKQTLSPLIQNHWLKQNKVNCAYLALEAEAKNLKVIVEALKALNFVGFNLTVPLKTAIIPYLNHIDKSAKILGSVNTVKIEGGKLYGYNTDYLGLDDDMKFKNLSAKGKDVFIYGAGGAARSVIYVCKQQGAKNIYLANRTYKNAAALASKFHVKAIERNVTGDYLEKADLIFNASSCGLEASDFLPFDISQLKKSTFIYDIICMPRTPFIRLAKKRHLSFDTGEGMLISQGAQAYKIWFGNLPDIKGARKLIKSKQKPSLSGVI